MPFAPLSPLGAMRRPRKVAPAFSPSALPMSAWYEDDYGLQAKDASGNIFAASLGDWVYQWLDKSANHYNLIQDVETDRYKRSATGLYFDGGADYYGEGKAWMYNSNPISVQEIWAVVQRVPKYDNIPTLVSSGDGGGGPYRVNLRTSSGEYQSGNANDYSYPNGKIYVNGVETRTVPSGFHLVRAIPSTSPLDSFARLWLGRSLAFSQVVYRPWEGFIRALYIPSARLSTTQATSLSNYIGAKYALTLST